MKHAKTTTNPLENPARRELFGSVLASATLAPRRRRSAANCTVITVFLRGGSDGLSLVAPVNDTTYTQARGANAIPVPPGQGAQWLDDGFGNPQHFALGPGASRLAAPYGAGRLAFAQLAGLTGTTRSHFEAMFHLETANDPTAVVATQTDGWVARHMNLWPSGNLALRGISHGSAVAQTLRDAELTLPIPDPRNFDLLEGAPCATAAQRKSRISEMHANDPVWGPQILGQAGTSTIDVIDIFGRIGYDDSRLDDFYPAPGQPTPFGDAMWKTAYLLAGQASESELCLEGIHLDIGGWDLHQSMGPFQGGALYGLQQQLSAGLAAFDVEMQYLGLQDSYVLFVMSEFGRRVDVNGNGGTDHGHGNCWIVMGAGVNGGKVYSDGWDPSVPLSSLMTNQNDLQIKLDCRDIFGEGLIQVCGRTIAELGDPNGPFPGFTAQQYNPRGIFS